MVDPKLAWDFGTAYDFFMSLCVLHDPDKWGLRGAWAAGVRSRLSADHRDFLKDVQSIVWMPLPFVHKLESPKSAQIAIDCLRQLPADARFESLVSAGGMSSHYPEMSLILDRVADTGMWDDNDVKQIYKLEKQLSGKSNKKNIQRWLHWWINRPEFGERIVPALQNYYDVFFAEEEARIYRYLVDAQRQAQAMSDRMSVNEMIEDLTGGVRYGGEQLDAINNLVLAPSFWGAPFLIIGDMLDDKHIYLYPARPETASLVPGEVVPDALYQALKALADPTRLKILKYLSAEPQTPTELANKLRLRPPTVHHHLHTLRLAQLVYVTLYADSKRYAARTEAISGTLITLENFLKPE